VMRSLRDEGKAIVFITHKLREVREIADKITVIRHGKVVGAAKPTDSESDLAELMVGRAVNLLVDKKPASASPEPRLLIRGLFVGRPNGTLAVDDLDLEVYGGEIVCIAGVQGNGQTELAEALLGVTPVLKGTIELDGKRLTGLTPRETIDAGLGFVPEDRKQDGCVGTFTVAENLILNHHDERPYARGIALNLSKVRQNAAHRISEFDIRTQSIEATVSSLSGGNQQKVVLARELSRTLALLVACQPTRGLDVGAIEFVHKRLVEERDRGTAVVIVSTELDEVSALADRIAVMYRGRIVGIVPPDTSREVLGLMMAGVPTEEALASASMTTLAEEDAALEASLEKVPRES
jgi:general nucleoside transport system ATP-binding protein